MTRHFFLTLVMAWVLTSQCWAGGFSLQGDELDYDMESNLGVAKGHVILEQDGGRATGDYAQFNNKEKTGYLQGHVVADKDGYHITAHTMTVHDEEHVSASGQAVLVKDGRTLKAHLIEYFKKDQLLKAGNGRALLKDVDGSTLEADTIDYSHEKGLAHANGNVQIRSEVRKLTASADRAVYRIHDDSGTTNYLELIGNATATQDGNTVRGNHLKLNNTKVAQAEGRVVIDYTPKATAPKAKPEVKPVEEA